MQKNTTDIELTTINHDFIKIDQMFKDYDNIQLENLKLLEQDKENENIYNHWMEFNKKIQKYINNLRASKYNQNIESSMETEKLIRYAEEKLENTNRIFGTIDEKLENTNRIFGTIENQLSNPQNEAIKKLEDYITKQKSSSNFTDIFKSHKNTTKYKIGVAEQYIKLLKLQNPNFYEVPDSLRHAAERKDTLGKLAQSSNAILKTSGIQITIER